MLVDFNSRICCDLCVEIIQEYLDICPVCEKVNTPTNIYQSLISFCKGGNRLFKCLCCNSQFEIIDCIDYDEAEVNRYEENNILL